MTLHRAQPRQHNGRAKEATAPPRPTKAAAGGRAGALRQRSYSPYRRMQHGGNGTSAQLPNIAGQNEAYLIARLIHLRTATFESAQVSAARRSW